MPEHSGLNAHGKYGKPMGDEGLADPDG